MTHLPELARSNPRLTRPAALGLITAALVIGALPTLQERVALAAPESAAAKAAGKQAARRTMSVLVLGADGKPLAGANVHASVWTKEPFRANRDYLTDRQGLATVELPRTLDILRLRANADKHVPQWTHWEEDWVKNRPLPDEFIFEMPKGTTIGGVVKNDQGQPIAGAKVAVSLSALDDEDPQNQQTTDEWLAEGRDAHRPTPRDTGR